MTEDQRLALLNQHYGLTQAERVVDNAYLNIKALFKERQTTINDKKRTIERAIDGKDALPELFEGVSGPSPEIELLISNPLADLPAQ